MAPYSSVFMELPTLTSLSMESSCSECLLLSVSSLSSPCFLARRSEVWISSSRSALRLSTPELREQSCWAETAWEGDRVRRCSHWSRA